MTCTGYGLSNPWQVAYDTSECMIGMLLHHLRHSQHSSKTFSPYLSSNLRPPRALVIRQRDGSYLAVLLRKLAFCLYQKVSDTPYA